MKRMDISIAIAGIVLPAVTALVVSLITNIVQNKRINQEIEILKLNNPIAYITRITTDPAGYVSRGNRLRIDYTIENPRDTKYSCWLGASLASLANPDGGLYYNTAEDIVVHIEPGKHQYTRYLTINENWLPGKYKLAVQVWHGVVNDSQKSKVIDQAQTEIVIQ